MKRTPLRRTGSLKRKPVKWRRSSKPKFPDGLHEQVIRRDGMCIIRMADPDHICHDMNGPHSATDLGKLTVDHFWPFSGGVRGIRAEHTLQTLTAMCRKSNVDGPPSWVRDFQRAYTRRLYPEAA